MRLSLVLPCLNEEKNIQKTISDVFQWMQRSSIDGEIIVVNDGSTDGTQSVLDQLQDQHSILKVVRHETNRGYGAAVRSGCDAANKEFIAFMDSDGQFHPEDFDKLLPHLEQFDFVTGRRRKRADPPGRQLNAKLFGLLSFIVLGIWVRDINCAMKVFRRATWEKIRPDKATGALFNAEVFFKLQKEGIPWHQVDVHHYPRQFGQQTGANLSVIFRMFLEIVVLRFRG